MNAELIKALRCKTNNVNDCTMCAYHNACYDGTLENIAADVIETDEKFMAQFIENIEHWKKQVIRLRAQLPKEGEWIEANTRPRSAQFYCSICHRTCYDIQPTRDKAWTKRCRYQFCPNCGAKMDGERKEKEND